jgi:hypothetical protein
MQSMIDSAMKVAMIDIPNLQCSSNGVKKVVMVVIDSTCANDKKKDLTKMRIKFGNCDTSSNHNINLDDIDLEIKNINNNIEKIELSLDNMAQINKLIPISISLEQGKINYIMWFEPTAELVSLLPESVRRSLEPEMLAIQSTPRDACKGAPVESDKAIFDVWRACAGAIEKLSIYPNPSKGAVNINYSLTGERTVTVTVHDLSGKELFVLQGAKTLPAGDYKDNFTLRGLPAGMYLISVTTNKEERAVQRVIIEE